MSVYCIQQSAQSHFDLMITYFWLLSSQCLESFYNTQVCIPTNHVSQFIVWNYGSDHTQFEGYWRGVNRLRIIWFQFFNQICYYQYIEILPCLGSSKHDWLRNGMVANILECQFILWWCNQISIISIGIFGNSSYTSIE